MSKNIFILLIAVVMVSSSLAITVANNESTPGVTVVQMPGITSTTAFAGNITIYANGTVSSQTVIGQVGNQYALKENLNGTLIDLRSNSIVSGNGYTINGMGKDGFNITNTSSVEINDFRVVNSSTGAYVVNSTHVTIADSNITAASYGAYSIYSAFLLFSADKLSVPTDYGIYVTDTPQVFINSTYVKAARGFETTTSTIQVEFNNDTIITSSVGICFDGSTNSNTIIANNTIVGINAGYGIEICSDNANNITVVNNNIDNMTSKGFCADVNSGFNYVLSKNFFVSDIVPVSLYDLYNVLIQGNHFNHSTGSYVIEAEYIVNVTLSGNIIKNFSSASGIYLDYSDYINIQDNFIQNTSDAIDLCYVNNINVTGNSISKASYGVYLYSYEADNVNVSSNMLSNITTDAIEFEVDSGTNYIVNNNVILNSSYPIYIYYDIKDININGNMIFNTTGYAIYVEYTSMLSVSGNMISGFKGSATSQYGIYVEYSGQATVSNNVILGNASANGAEGIYLYKSSLTSLFGNTVLNTTYGIDVEYSGTFSVFNNTVQKSQYGIYSYENSQFSYFSNSIISSNYSLYSEYDYGGVIYGNTFSIAKTYMVYLDYSAGLSFYHNNFINGSRVAIYVYSSSLITWNMSLPVAGNYWSSYTGTGSNGIGTTPYIVNGTLKDYLPLTGKWTGYTVTFVESGLPSGTPWSVTLGMSTLTSETKTVPFSPDAAQHVTENYSVGEVSGYTVSQKTGSVTLSGTNKVISLTFTPVTYEISFSETGLPSGTTWALTVGNIKESSSNASVSLSLPNGTYNYTIQPVSGYHAVTDTGSFQVDAAGRSISVTFEQNLYTLMVTETGLPSGMAWTVNVSGTLRTTTGTSVDIMLASGTYNVSVTGPSSYSSTISVKSVTIGTSNTTVSVVFTNTTAPSKTSNSASIYEGLGAGAIVGVVVGILGTMMYTGTGIFRKFKKGNN